MTKTPLMAKGWPWCVGKHYELFKMPLRLSDQNSLNEGSQNYEPTQCGPPQESSSLQGSKQSSTLGFVQWHAHNDPSKHDSVPSIQPNLDSSRSEFERYH